MLILRVWLVLPPFKKYMALFTQVEYTPSLWSGIYSSAFPQENGKCMSTKTYTRIFVAALFIIAPHWKVDKPWYIPTM